MCTLEEKTALETAEDKYTLKYRQYEMSLIRLKVLLNNTDDDKVAEEKYNVLAALEEAHNAFKSMEIERYKACNHIWFIDKDDRCLCARCGADSIVLKDATKLTEMDYAKDALCSFLGSVDLENLPGKEVFVDGDLCSMQQIFIKVSNNNPESSDEELVTKFESEVALTKTFKPSNK